MLFSNNDKPLDPTRSSGEFTEVNGLTNILVNTDGSFYYKPLYYNNIYFNIELITQNVIVIQDILKEKTTNKNFDDYCNKILLDEENLIKMKPFFSLDNYIMTFIVAINARHWVCYTINKFKNASGRIDKQVLFMDSDRGNYDITTVGYFNKISRIVNYDDYVNELTKCYKPPKIDKFSKYISEGQYLKLLQFVYKYYSKFTDGEINKALETIYTEIFKVNLSSIDDLIDIITNTTPKMKNITKTVLNKVIRLPGLFAGANVKIRELITLLP